jgi:hypothetical protein
MHGPGGPVRGRSPLSVPLRPLRAMCGRLRACGAAGVPLETFAGTIGPQGTVFRALAPVRHALRARRARTALGTSVRRGTGPGQGRAQQGDRGHGQERRYQGTPGITGDRKPVAGRPVAGRLGAFSKNIKHHHQVSRGVLASLRAPRAGGWLSEADPARAHPRVDGPESPETRPGGRPLSARLWHFCSSPGEHRVELVDVEDGAVREPVDVRRPPMTYAAAPAGLAGHGEGPGTVPSQAMPGPPSPVGRSRSHSQYPAGPRRRRRPGRRPPPQERGSSRTRGRAKGRPCGAVRHAASTVRPHPEDRPPDRP